MCIHVCLVTCDVDIGNLAKLGAECVSYDILNSGVACETDVRPLRRHLELLQYFHLLGSLRCCYTVFAVREKSCV